MNPRRQNVLFSTSPTSFGGSLNQGKRKSARPIVTKRPMHLVLRSSNAKGELSLIRESAFIRLLIQRMAKGFHVQVYEQAINGNHIHLLVKAMTRDGFKQFSMGLSGRIAQRMTGATKGAPLEKKFWDFSPFTRVVEWGRDFLNAKKYVVQNVLEAAGLIPYQPRGKRKPAKSPPAHHENRLAAKAVPSAFFQGT